MCEFKIGDLVCLRERTDKRGIINKIYPKQNGFNYYDVSFIDGNTGSYPSYEIQLALPTDNPWDLFAKNMHKGYEEFGLVTTYHKIKNTTSNILSTLRASRTQFKPYQYKPLVKFLNSNSRRILIADEVGLGKTIEAGHIMLELAGRGELKNVMIVCPKSLKDKWQMELKEKFNFHFKIITSRNELLSDYKYSIATGEPFRVIATYGNIRTETDDRRNLKEEKNSFLIELEKNVQSLDLLICDEAHYVRNINLTHRGIKKVADASNAVVLLTATPLMTGVENLYHLLSVLEPELFYDNTVFQNAINLNKPFIKALNKLNSGKSFKEISEELQNSEIEEVVSIGDEYKITEKQLIKDFFKGDPLFNRVIESLNSLNRKPDVISSIQKDLTDLNSLNHLYTRTRKRDVFTDGKLAVRNTKSIFVDLTDEERKLYDDVIEEYSGEPLALVTKKRAVSSCIPAYYENEHDLLKGLFNRDIVDSKFNDFWNIVDEVVLNNNKKLIVFAFFRKTLLYLKARIESQGIKCVLLYGSTQDRQKIVEEFRDNDDVKIFLSSQVGTEGLDLQFCNAVVNYDLPWNPMVVEQRIGRVDRIGQKESVVNIYTLVLKNTIEAQIHKRLLERIGVFKESIGDLESILAEEGSSMEKLLSTLEKELYSLDLTEEQRKKQIDDIAVAIENEKNDLEYIEKGLTDSMVNDIYFRNSIDSIIKHQQYITSKDILFYIRWFLREKFPSVLFNELDDNLYEIILPKGNINILFDYMREVLESEKNKDVHVLFYSFINRYRYEEKIRVTFDQDFATSNPGIEYINSYHPLVMSISKFIENKKLHVNQVFQFSLSKTFLSESEEKSYRGDYLMVIYKIIVERKSGKVNKHIEYLHPVILDANTSEIIFLPEDDARYLFGISQQYAKEIDNKILFDDEIVNQLRPNFLDELKRIQKDYYDEEKIKLESFQQRTIKQIDKYFKSRIERRKMQLEQLEPDSKLIPMTKKNIESLVYEYEQKRRAVEEMKLYVDNSLVSISYINIE